MEARPHSTAAELVARLWTNEEPGVVSFGTDGAYFRRLEWRQSYSAR